MVHETKLTSVIAYLTHTCLAQSVKHRYNDQEVLCSIRTGAIFFAELIVLIPIKAGRILLELD